MKSFALLALAGTALAQSSPPAGCQASTTGTFNIATVNVTSRKRDLESRQLAGTLTLSLQNGNLRDQAGRTGYIASNYQFQFDAPVQAGAREQTGFSLCNNGSLALGSSAIWYQCLSGTFYNLYSQSTGAQCIPIFITAVRQGGASQIPDGQPQVTSQRPAVSQISDGQPQAPSARPPVVSQISDGQPQAPSARPPVVSQISDGQPQVGTPRPQPTPTPARPVVSQISDGQPQVGTPAPRPTPTPARPVVSQISDGQPQVGTPQPAPSRPLVSQISDGQPQVPIATRTGNVTVPTRTAPPQFTGAAATSNAATGAFLAGLFGLFAML